LIDAQNEMAWLNCLGPASTQVTSQSTPFVLRVDQLQRCQGMRSISSSRNTSVTTFSFSPRITQHLQVYPASTLGSSAAGESGRLPGPHFLSVAFSGLKWWA